MSKAPDYCLYCDREGNSSAGGRCGFCENGKPLDTQEDWDESWGKIMDASEDAFGMPIPSIMEKILLRFSDKKRKEDG